MRDDGQFGDAVHALLRELGWTHGELTPSLVHQALAQVRHLRKQAAQLAAVTSDRDEANARTEQMKLEVFEACEESHECARIVAEYGCLVANAPRDGVRALAHRYESTKEQLDKQLAHSAKLFRDAKAFADERDTARAEVERMRAELQRWKDLGERHNIEPRESGCQCTWEQGDSACPVHPTCANCGCTEPNCERWAECDYHPVKAALTAQREEQSK